jgi:hypothetical protein
MYFSMYTYTPHIQYIIECLLHCFTQQHEMCSGSSELRARREKSHLYVARRELAGKKNKILEVYVGTGTSAHAGNSLCVVCFDTLSERSVSLQKFHTRRIFPRLLLRFHNFHSEQKRDIERERKSESESEE